MNKEGHKSSIGYAKYIASVHGGLDRDKLESKLMRLIKKVETETIEENKLSMTLEKVKVIVKKQENSKDGPKSISDQTHRNYITGDVEKSINSIIDSSEVSYRKVELIINVCKTLQSSWIKLSIIPDELFETFITFYDYGKSGIVIDTFEDDQYFKIV